MKIGDTVERINKPNGIMGAFIGQLAKVVGIHEGYINVTYTDKFGFYKAELWNPDNAVVIENEKDT